MKNALLQEKMIKLRNKGNFVGRKTDYVARVKKCSKFHCCL